MGATRKDLNKSFFWEQVEGKGGRFTPNEPVNWRYEVRALFHGEDEEIRPAEWTEPDSPHAPKPRLDNTKLLELAERYPPPPEWFDEDEECPF